MSSSSLLRISNELAREIRREQEINKKQGIHKSLTDCSKDILKYSRVGRGVLNKRGGGRIF